MDRQEASSLAVLSIKVENYCGLSLNVAAEWEITMIEENLLNAPEVSEPIDTHHHGNWFIPEPQT